MIRLTCPSCVRVYEVVEKYGGKIIACPACKAHVKVPLITTTPACSEMPTPAKRTEPEVAVPHEIAEKRSDGKNATPAPRSVQSQLSKSGKGMWGLIAGGVGLLAFFGMCGCCAFAGMLSRQQGAEEFAEANRLWAAGDKPGAVSKYKAVINRSDTVIGKEQSPTIYQRVIEFEAEQGNTSAARGFIELADKRKIPLSLESPTAKDVMAQFQKEK